MIARTAILLSVLSTFMVKAQDTLHYRLQEVSISEMRFQLSGNEHQTDTSVRNLLTSRTAGELLSREPGVFIRNYGPGNISTLSLRGLSAVHTPFFWHGLPVNSPMLGLTDLSILPTFLTGRMSIHYGGLAPLNGSGAVSGSIHLGDPENKAEGCHIGLLTTGGSFGERQAGLEIELNQAGISNRTRFYSSGCTNDFPYTTPEGRRVNQVHAEMRLMGFTHDFVLQSKNHRLESHLWYLESDRDLPPHMLAESGSQEQSDGSLRWITTWTRSGVRSHVRLLGGMSREQLRFEDASVRLDDLSKSINSIAGVEGGYLLHPSLRLEGQMAVQHAAALSDGYTRTAEQEQLNFTGKAVVEKKDFALSLAVRYGLAGGNALPLLPSLNTKWKLNKVLSLQAEGSRVYRIPTLNDLYWKIGGNPDLRPERGWSTSAGFHLQDDFNRIHWSITTTLFFISLNDALTWLPDEQAIYRAMNMHGLLSKGIESSMNINWTSSVWKFTAAWSPTLTSSVVTPAAEGYGHLSGRQLPYTPKLSHKGFMEIEHRGFGIRYMLQYYGHRFTTEDHGYFLAPYSVSDLVLSWRNGRKKTPITLTFAVKNILNEEYQVMAWRAMPGRSYQAGLILSLPEPAR